MISSVRIVIYAIFVAVSAMVIEMVCLRLLSHEYASDITENSRSVYRDLEFENRISVEHKLLESCYYIDEEAYKELNTRIDNSSDVASLSAIQKEASDRLQFLVDFGKPMGCM